IEAGEMPPQDLGGAIALDPLRPAVPARDDALAVEHVDRAVLDAVDQQLKLGRALLETALGHMARRDLAFELDCLLADAPLQERLEAAQLGLVLDPVVHVDA